VAFPDVFRATVRASIDQAAAANRGLSDDMRAAYTKQLRKLDGREDYFLDLDAEEGWPKDKLRTKLDAIRTKRASITRTLDHAETHLDDGIHLLTLAPDLMTDPHGMYDSGSEETRTIFNRAIFTKLYVDGRVVVGHELHEPFDAYSVWQGRATDTTSGHRHPNTPTGPRSPLHGARPPQSSNAAPETGYGATGDHVASPALALCGQGSSKTPMVGTTGSEPVTPRL
jgi:site-specific DNA recombinase